MPTVVITGASQGIGRAIAKAFAQGPDARLALLARTTSKLEVTAEQCRQHGAETAVYPCDVTQEAAVRHSAGQILDAWGAPDIVVNNAGAFQPGAFRETTLAQFRTQLDANLTSAFLVTQAFLDAMLERGAGHFFFMGSVASIKAYPGGVAYCAAKHGLLGLARVLREELKGEGLRVTTLLPGATYTPSWEGSDLPEDRFMPPEDIAQTVVDAWKLSSRSVVEEILLRPQEGDV